MSKLGIQCVKYSKIKDGKYTGPKDISTLVTFNGSPNVKEGEDWGDNRKVASHRSVNKIALSMELNDLRGDKYADICGHAYDETEKKVTVKDTDNSPYVGIGAIGNSEGEDGKTVYILKIYPCMQFSEPNDDNSTENDSVNYKHVTLEGTGYPDKEGRLKIEQEFDTLEAAKDELDKFLAVSTESQAASVTEGQSQGE